MATRGRKRIEIDQTQFEGLCKLQCTLDEIAGWFTCSPDTIERWCKREYGMKFAEIYKIKSAGGKISIRRAQFRLAETNAAVAIWLGKQYLGQKEPTTEVAVENDTLQQAREILSGLESVIK